MQKTLSVYLLRAAQAFLTYNTTIMILSGVTHTFQIAPIRDASNSINRTQLTKIRSKAIRAGIWFKTLPRIDRVLVDLTIKVVENIRSSHLVKSILAVIGKLEELLENGFLKSIRAVGRLLAERISVIAQKWGNVSAKSWGTDPSFVSFLGSIHERR